jgi:hypothetical protein
MPLLKNKEIRLSKQAISLKNYYIRYEIENTNGKAQAHNILVNAY